MEKAKEKKCSSCGELMGPEDAFCRNCGSRFTEETGLEKCSSCGKPMEPGAVFCTNCGNRSEKREAGDSGGASLILSQLAALANEFLTVREVSPVWFEFSSQTGSQAPFQKVSIQYDAVVQLEPEKKQLTFWEKMVESSVGTNAGVFSEVKVQKGIGVDKKIHGQLLLGGKYGFEYGKLREVVKTIAEEQGWQFKTVILKPKMNVASADMNSRRSIPLQKILLAVLFLFVIAALGTAGYLFFADRSKSATSQTENVRSDSNLAEDPDRPGNENQMSSEEPRILQKGGTVAGGRPFVITDRDVYTYGERIKVYYYNAPGYSRDWICIVRAGSSRTAAGNYKYIPRGGRGVLSFKSPRPGKYEARAYYSYSPFEYAISARHSFTVVNRPFE
jgi:RNA polymerase subunit RPABC4/transcription elongation factor Spt4